MTSKLSARMARAQFEYADTLVNQGVNLGVAAGTPRTLLSTYTVGAGRVSTLEATHMRCSVTVAIASFSIEILVTRSGVSTILAEMFSVANTGIYAYTAESKTYNLKLNAGDTVRLYVTNSSAGTVFTAISAFFREVVL
jgi:hypothetical protein